ncbi:MAG: hypothetical protein HYT76_09675 [Deltaproteobacteria bacterium]|nr:hypothetical protein [Deltaproteobacteria bacterium]
MKLGNRGTHYSVETILKEFLSRVAEASYQVALRLGFRGSFVTFLSDLQEALEKVLEEDKGFRKTQLRKQQAHMRTMAH